MVPSADADVDDASEEDGGGPEALLLRYLEESYMMDQALSLDAVKEILAESTPESFDWTTTSDDGAPMLHLAAMNEASEPEELSAVVAELLRFGAPPDGKDRDGDDALDAVVSLTEEVDEEDAGEEGALAVKKCHVASAGALLQCPGVRVDEKRVLSICSWLRRYMPEDCQQKVLALLRTRFSPEEVGKIWCSEELLAYLEDAAYEKKAGVESAVVSDFISRGARPGHKQNGATALLLVVLNPHTKYLELREIFRAIIAADPQVVTSRDGFGLSALQWAADYTNVAQQHGLKRPNPAGLLALLPTMVSLLPPEVDASEACLKTSPDGTSAGSPVVRNGSAPPPSLRFLEGDRVLCRVEAPGQQCVWEEGVVVGTWYREGCWPMEHPGAPYEVVLDIGTRVFALVDHDRIIRPEGVGKKPKATVTVPSVKVKPKLEGGGAPAKAGSRFVRQQREDGQWEMLDTVSGKSRIVSPPDSDDDSQ